METKTPNTEKSISAAFDSVNLINKLITETADDKKKSTVERNVKHLELMLTKDFFINALTPIQKTEIETSISNGNAYIV
jgi:hypothetical protein